ncbi:MAG: hypothetical protein H6851_11775 [Geminicoccaceae bacterium]|nr:hypothetical protein [Geminicoccaceae bacterium]MCB9944282.1 hypothetical protein [Geminicoccaceae bacterium]
MSSFSTCSFDRPAKGLSRRGFVVAAGAAGGFFFAGRNTALASAYNEGGSVSFRVFRKGEDIGSHRVLFEKVKGELISRVEVDLKVKVAFVTAYSFEQQTRDHWRDGVLVRSTVHTDDDGEVSKLHAEKEDGKLLVDGPKGLIDVPLGLMTDTCFWNSGIVELSQLIESDRGDLAPIDVKFIGGESVDIGGRRVSTRHFRITSSSGRSGDIWYDEKGRWVKSTIHTRGETLDYRLVV